jgi:succinate dehydrogenase hydrophobic anchor subunit
MQNQSILTNSGEGSENWVIEKFAKAFFLPSSLYIFFYFLLSYKLTGLQFYLNLFFVNLLNISVMAMFMLSGGVLAILRFRAIIEDYIKGSHKRMLLRILFTGFNIFSFTFLFFTFIYFNFIISITSL